MGKESLDSDRVNYLIWRYLLESDYRETAAHLQKEWNLTDPQKLPFAPHVTNRALVSIVNKGLLYNVAERELVRNAHDRRVPGVFGPVTPTSPCLSPEKSNEEESDQARKRHTEDAQSNLHNGPAKRPRLSNGYENGFEAVLPPTMTMDVDSERNTDGRAYPSPEQVSSPVAPSNGAAHGTQSETVLDLTGDTQYLDLTEAVEVLSSSRASTLLHCAWHPKDPTILAAAGTDALARMWTFASPHPANASATPNTAANLNRGAAASRVETDARGNITVIPYGVATPPQAMDKANRIPSKMPSQRDLLDPEAPSTTTATALSWASDGSGLLIANEPVEDALARIDVYAPFGMRIISLDGFESPIYCARWNFSDNLVVTLSPFSGTTGAMISVVRPDAHAALHYPLPNHDLGEIPLDVVWTSDEDFIICGGDLLQALHVAEGAITPLRKYETHDDHALSKIVFDWPSQLLATASYLGKIDVWEKEGHCRFVEAHQGLITALIWRPLPMQGRTLLEDSAERLLASAGEDGAISIWDARSLDTKPKASMTMRSAVLAMAFTPDGEFIAGATHDQILIWRVDDVTMPKACWNRGAEMELGWQTPQSRDSVPEEDHYCLSWDAAGKKLAYGVNNMLAIVHFPR